MASRKPTIVAEGAPIVQFRSRWFYLISTRHPPEKGTVPFLEGLMGRTDRGRELANTQTGRRTLWYQSRLDVHQEELLG
jgi:hypothetical protein